MLIRRIKSGEHFELKSGERITNLGNYTISLLFTYPDEVRPSAMIHSAEEHTLKEREEANENQAKL